ncbi:MAG: hypothetical protein K9M54_06870 [Kiritimatiellales bacterium]|nr:hypothetical protein [Kiritimatiellales bacterium]MCF7863202.1 hypothetical protein [Kiritimatiellales bacterium]
MKKNQFNITILSVVAVVLMASVPVRADLATASGTLAEVATLTVQAKANLASAANSGDVNAIADAAKRADAVDAAMAEAQDAFSALERAVAGNDQDAAAAASDDLDAARQKAFDALFGAVPEASPQSEHAKWVEGQKNTGGGPGRAYDPPNIYDRPWDTQGLRSFYQGLFGTIWESQGNRGGFNDRDATPE